MQRVVLLLGCTSLMTGCAQGLPGLRPLTYAIPGQARLFVSSEQCIHTPVRQEAASLIGGIAMTAVSKLLENFGTTLSKAAEGGDLPTVSAMRNLTLEPGQLPSCITMVRGAFVPENGAETAIDLKELVANPADPEQMKRFDALGIPTAYRVDQFIELELRQSPNQRALTYFPRFALLKQSLDGSQSGNRDLSIALKFSSPGNDEAGSVVLLPNLHIGVPRTAEVDSSGHDVFEAPWFAFPNGKPESDNAAARNRASMASGNSTGISGGAGLGSSSTGDPPSLTVNPYSPNGTAMPVTVTVTTVETRPTREGLAFIAAVFNGARPQIESAIGEQVNPGGQ